MNAIDIKGDSITMDYESIMAIYNGLEDGSHINMEFNNGILDPSSISKAAKSTSDFFLQDLYEIACNPNMVELCTSTKNKYIMNGQEESQEWNAPYEDNDYDLAPSVLSFLKTSHLPIGRHIQGNTGQSLFPNFNQRGRFSLITFSAVIFAQ